MPEIGCTFHEALKNVKEIQWEQFKGHFSKVSTEFQGNPKEAQGSFKVVSRKIEDNLILKSNV